MKARRLFILGTAAGGVAVGASLLVRLLLGGAYLPELAADSVFSLVPGAIESQAVENLGPLAKYTTFAVASVLNAVVLGLIPVVLQRLGRIPQGRIRAAAVFVVSPYAVMLALGLLFHSLAQASQPVSLGSLALSLLVPSLVFGGVLGATSFAPRPAPHVLFPMERSKRGANRKRRLFIKSAIATTVAAALLYYGVGFLLSKKSPLPSNEEASLILAAQVTPNDEFYRVDINVIPPSVDASTWSLNLHGLVDTPMELDYDQLTSLPSVQEYATLECVSNEVGGDLMSTALWKGVQLKSILNMVGVGPSANYVVFRCYDGYDVGIPLERAMADGTILAYEMNGDKLPTEHGYPVRAIVPGLYGMMNAKWVTDIELVNGVYDGFWAQRGWTDIATYQTGSAIITPGSNGLRDKFNLPPSLNDVAGNPIPVVGTAFAGDRGIQKVEVSTDGGNTWQMASLYDPLSQYTWVFWKLEWNPPSTGNYELMVRATDGNGQVQVATMTPPYPNGATGYNMVDVQVSSV